MSEEAAFLQEIRSHPAEDLPRLIYADWLEERGDPRAEFLRVQCELARLSATERSSSPLAKHETELLIRNRREWITALEKLGVSNPQYVRGFIEELHVKAELFPRSARKLVELAPLADSLRLKQVEGNWVNICRTPELIHFRSLACLYAHLRNVDLQPFGQSESVRKLTSLDLYCSRLTAGVVPYLDTPHLANLESLSLAANPFGDDGLEALSKTRHLQRLISLNLRDSGVCNQGLHLLAGSEFLGQLRSLDLSFNEVRMSGIRALAQSDFAEGLRALKLRRVPLSPEAIEALATSESLANLELLDLREVPIAPESITWLENATFLPKLKVLRLHADYVMPSNTEGMREVLGEKLVLHRSVQQPWDS